MTLTQLRQNQPEWFSRKNKRFFGDMFDQNRRLHYRVNRIVGDLMEDRRIGPLVDTIFPDLWAVKSWLAVN